VINFGGSYLKIGKNPNAGFFSPCHKYGAQEWQTPFLLFVGRYEAYLFLMIGGVTGDSEVKKYKKNVMVDYF
jgi:hypothetical protein